MRADRVRYFIMAALGLSLTDVYYGNQPAKIDDCVTVYSEDDEMSVHSGVIISSYQAVIRNKIYTTAESLARSLYDAVHGIHNREAYNAIYLTSSMSAVTDPVSFAPDDGAGSTTAALFTVGDYILIDDEVLKVTIVSSPNVTVSRAQLGTTIAAHDNNDQVHNISENPIPGETTDFSRATTGVMGLGTDSKQRKEFSLNWNVTVKP